MRLLLEPARAELVRAFVREDRMCESVGLTTAGLIADDTARAWQALCSTGSGQERACIQVLCAGQDVSRRFILPGHARFANSAASFAGRVREEAAISWRERGLDEWEV